MEQGQREVVGGGDATWAARGSQKGTLSERCKAVGQGYGREVQGVVETSQRADGPEEGRAFH